MARTANATQSRKVEPTIPVGAYERLEYLAKRGMHGSNPTEVARYLLIQSLNDLTRDGILPAELP